MISSNFALVACSMSGIGAGSPIFDYDFAHGEVFEVQLTSYTGPGAPGGNGIGSLQAHVNGAIEGVPQGTPEPGSLSLMIGIGVAGSVFARRWRTV